MLQYLMDPNFWLGCNTDLVRNQIAYRPRNTQRRVHSTSNVDARLAIERRLPDFSSLVVNPNLFSPQVWLVWGVSHEQIS